MRTHLLFFFLGLAGIAAEVAWMRLIQPAFGSTAETVAVVVGLYLGGLALGSFVVGRISRLTEEPSRGFRILAGVAGALLLVSPEIHGVLGLTPLILLAVLLGGAWPLVAQTVSPATAGRGIGRLALANNLGGVVGSLLAGFVLMPYLGISASVRLAGGILAVVALVGRLDRPGVEPPPPPVEDKVSPWRYLLVYAAAGIVLLGLEVTWTRLFSLIFQNSVYTFASVLAVFLLGLGLGGAIGGRAAQKSRDPAYLVCTALLVVACLGFLPGIFFAVALDIYRWWMAVGPGGHVSALAADFIVTAILILPATVAMGSLFPLLSRILGEREPALGKPVGTVYAVGTLASVLGGPVAAFVLIPVTGTMRTIEVLCAFALLAGLWAARTRSARRLIAMGLLPFLVLLFGGRRAPGPSGASLLPGEQIIHSVEGPGGHAAVVHDEKGNRRLKVNGTYSMGGDLGVRIEKRQGAIPEVLNPSANKTLVIGLGTGVTFGQVLRGSAGRAVCVEILPEVVRLSGHFRQDNCLRRGVFRPGCEIVIGDGRTYIRDTGETWDLIIADLFFPWRKGVGPLYTEEHFRTAREKLSPEGEYWQWFALHQLTVHEVRILCATFASVFPEVEIWMADLSAQVPVAALRGYSGRRQAFYLKDEFFHPEIGFEYPGDLPALRIGGTAAVRSFCEGAPIQTDDHPLIEFSSAKNWYRDAVSILRPNLEALVSMMESSLEAGPLPPGGPRRAALMALRAELSFMDGDAIGEMRWHLQALQVTPDFTRSREAVLHRARTYLADEKPESARQILAAFLELFPDDLEAAALLEQCGKSE